MQSEENPIVLENENPSSEEFFNSDVGITEAARITGKNKGRISLDSNGNVLKFTLNEQGNRRYKVSDLYALYGLKNPDKTVNESNDNPVFEGSKTQGSKPFKKYSEPQELSKENLLEIALLKQQVQYQHEQLRRSEDEIRYLRGKQDTLIEQNHRLSLLLPSPASVPSKSEQ